MTKTISDLPAINEDGPSFSIPGFCEKENISLSSYHTVKRRGLGPEELRIPGTTIVRITAKARREWHELMAKLATEEAARLEQQRRVEHASAAGKAAAQSEKHVSKRGRRNSPGRNTP